MLGLLALEGRHLLKMDLQKVEANSYQQSYAGDENLTIYT